MPSLIVFAGIVFVAMLGAAWLVLRIGSQWFANRQNQSAASAKTNLEEMFIFTDGGNSCRNDGINSLIESVTATVFVPGCR